MQMTNSEQILARMEELAKRLEYDFHDLSYLAQAMYCEREKGRFNYTNDAMATVGDAVMKLIWSEYFFDKGLDKDEITVRKAALEQNATLRKISDEKGIARFAYNDEFFADEAPDNRKLPYGKHDIYVEAIIAAIYKDRGLDYVRQWLIALWGQVLRAQDL
jgi:dsRNA-specific ribonuclease